MKNPFIHYITFVIVLFLLCLFSLNVHAGNKYEHFFSALDSAISQHKEYESVLEVQIKTLKSERSRVNTAGDIYLINKLLASKYANYICDSALVYLSENERIAIQENKRNWLHDIYLERGHIYIQTGMVNAAAAELDQIKIEEANDSDKAKYYALRIYLLEQEATFTGNSNPQKILEYGIELMKYTAIDDESYIWGLVWSYQGEDKNERIIDYLKREYEKNQLSNNQSAGNNALVLSKIYARLSNEEERIKYLCLAALSDVKHVNRDPSALLDLVSYLSSVGDSHRAYVYLDYILQGQSYYPARASGSHMAQHMKKIFEETRLRSEQEKHKTFMYMLWLSVAMILLIISFIITILFIRKSNRQKKSISEMNDQLKTNLSVLSKAKEDLTESNQKMKSMTEQILEANTKLKESNLIKEEYIGYIFSACSNYLTKMDEFRQNINRKIKTGKVEEALRMTQPTNTFLNNEIKALNQTFDSTFLSIYPDFVKDFNLLLHKEEQVVLHGNEEMNTELRIYALVWLGISSSSKIAGLLHISAQTVYNARMKMRNKAIIEGDLFAETVRSLGRKK